MCVFMYTLHIQYRIRHKHPCTKVAQSCKHALMHINDSVSLGTHTHTIKLCKVSHKKCIKTWWNYCPLQYKCQGCPFKLIYMIGRALVTQTVPKQAAVKINALDMWQRDQNDQNVLTLQSLATHVIETCL